MLLTSSHSPHFLLAIVPKKNKGRFYKLALTDCETIFEINSFVSEEV